jgi:glycosyltransferase involved in cell wall biosynthesis
MSIQISIIVPVYNEDESLPELSAWIKRVMDEHQFTYEVVMVDDGSSDQSWKVIQALSQENPCIKGLRFRRNYGKSGALNVGFQHCVGDVVITMDADMQDSPDELPDLYKMIVDEGFDLVSGWKEKRFDPITKTIPTKLFNYATRMMSGIHLHDFNCGLKAYKSDVVKSIEVYGEMHRYIPVIAKWAGFTKIGEKSVQHRARKYGTTKFGLERFVNGFLDLLSIFFVGKFGKRPMHFFGTLGSLSFLLGFISTCYIVGEKIYAARFTHNAVRDVVDKPSFYLALTAVIIGVQLFLAGFIGELVSRNGSERNVYNIREKAGY